MPGRKTGRNIIDWPCWDNGDEGAVLTVTRIQKGTANSFVVLVHITTTVLDIFTSLVALVHVTAAGLNTLTGLVGLADVAAAGLDALTSLEYSSH